MERISAICLLAAGAIVGMTACGPGGDGGSSSGGAKSKTVTIKGSDTMVILGQRWAETYMHHIPGVTVQVTGGGSGTGIAALINGGTDICESSRPMKDKEREQAKKRHGKDVREIPVALDGVAIYVHKDNPIKSVSLPQLKDLYTGKINNWKDLGAPESRIVAYSRENNSGTYVYFKEHVLANEDFAADVQTLPGTAAVVNAVSKDPKSIGYGGIAYSSGIRALPVSKDGTAAPVDPTLATVQDGSYPVSRELYFYTIGEPAGTVKAFVDWVLDVEGQKVCEKVGYYPLRKK
jgi:phosphate transport system substrate-binding protein